LTACWKQGILTTYEPAPALRNPNLDGNRAYPISAGFNRDDETLQDVWVRGEVSNLSRPQSGHLYFTLKDNLSALRCVMWREAVRRLSFTPRDGIALEAHGSLGIYEVQGKYQLYADVLRPLGEGVLFQEFLRIKARLEAEGLFAPGTKATYSSMAAYYWHHHLTDGSSDSGYAQHHPAPLSSGKCSYCSNHSAGHRSPARDHLPPYRSLTAWHTRMSSSWREAVVLSKIYGRSMMRMWPGRLQRRHLQ